MAWLKTKNRSLIVLLGTVVSLALVMVAPGPVVQAACNDAQSCSPSYKVNEAFFGSGGELNACSDQYCSKQAAGETTVGLTEGTNYRARAGFNTSDVPLLEVIVSGGVQDMGLLKPDRTGTATGSIKVRSYLSSGYVLLITGTPPSQGSHTLATDSSPQPSQQGREQFGINLVDNTTPNIGADPLQVPDASFSFGVAEPFYNQPDYYMYRNGDIVARSNSSTGETDYTLSMIANISEATAAGRYNGDYSAVVVPTY